MKQYIQPTWELKPGPVDNQKIQGVNKPQPKKIKI